MVVVHTGDGGGDCGIEFKEGAFLFYAYRDQTKEWHTNICTRSAPLETTGEEVLELDGKLPKPAVPARKPTLKFDGKLNDGTDRGWTFTLRNRLHVRIFYFDGDDRISQRIQVRRKGTWVDYAPNDLPSSKHPPQTQVDELLAKYPELDPERSVVYLDRQKSTQIYVFMPMMEETWRMGFQYVTEQALSSGAKIQDSKHCVWSEPMNPSGTPKAPARKKP